MGHKTILFLVIRSWVTFSPTALQKLRLTSVESLLFHSAVAQQFLSLEREISCVKQACLLSQNQIQEIVMDSDSDKEKY
jgi:hypothetical protein